jgi:protein-S-isoprenylcysteine O-methyltransferase Ste14
MHRNFFLLPFLATCLLNFGWGMRNFFVVPLRKTRGQILVGLAGALTALQHLIALIRAVNMPAGNFMASVCLYVLSLMVFWSAIAANRGRALAACFSDHAPSHVVQSGPYRFVRHPFYCSYLLTAIAGVAASADFALAPSVIILFAIYFTAAHLEEKRFAGGALATQYAAYTRTTGMFFPTPWRQARRVNETGSRRG